MRPNTTRVTNNADNLYTNIPDVVTLPRYFRMNGYATARCGKIFHLGVPSGNESMEDPNAWDFGTPFKDERPYPYEVIMLPTEPADDEEDIPLPARNGSVPGYALSTTPEQRRAAIRGYLATVSFMDAQAGRVLDALNRFAIEKNTIVVFKGDHGWHLGEHGLWHKRSLFEESAGVPFMIFHPNEKANGLRTASLAESLDVYPTLCDLTGLPLPKQLQGKSL